jgi:hypothetical protein
MKSRYQVTALLALALMIVAAFITRYSMRRDAVMEEGAVSQRFGFDHYPLSYVTAADHVASVREVNPSLQHMAAWISAVGAAVAINDLDGDGLNNDICLVDPRTDTVTVAPAPASRRRYQPFALVADSAQRAVAPMGCLPADFNQDGAMDLLVYYWGRPPVLFLHQGAAGPLSAASYVARDLAPATERWFSNAAVATDIDGDGQVDIVIGNYFADGAQILDASDHHAQRMNSSMSHAFNGGGKHIFLGTAAGKDVSFHEAQITILGSDGQPVNRTETDAILHGWTLALGAADLNHTLQPDLYIANDFGPDRLLQNESLPGNPRFRLIVGHRDLFTPKSKVLGRDSFKGMGVDFADLNNDGRLDILVSSITEEFGLEESNLDYINTCPVSGSVDLSRCLHDRSEKLGLARSGWSWDVKAADFDNSGTLQVVEATGFLRSPHADGGINRWPQLHETAMGNDVSLRFPQTWHKYTADDQLSGRDQDRFFVRRPGRPFVDISSQVGLRHDSASRGIAIADVDGDGRLDFAVANQWGPSDFYHNVGTSTGSELTLRVLLPLTPGSGFAVQPIGPVRGATWAMTAEATVTLHDGRRILQEVNGGNGHSGKNSFDLHFGLGASPADARIPVSLQWRDLSGRVHSRELQLYPGQYSILLGA